MSYLEIIKSQIGQDCYTRLEKEAEKELSLALKMPLTNQYGDKQYYRKRVLVGDIFPDCHRFNEMGLGISPLDVVDAVFRAKLLFASQDKESFLQRSGEGSRAIGIWEKKPSSFSYALECFFKWIENSIHERTLLTQLSSFRAPSANGDNAVETFFEQLFQKLGAPFVAFIDKSALMAKYQQLQPGMQYNEAIGQAVFLYSVRRL